MTDGTFIGVQPVKEIPDNLRSSQENALTLWSEIESFVSGIPELNRVYLVGAGGSLSGLNAAH